MKKRIAALTTCFIAAFSLIAGSCGQTQSTSQQQQQEKEGQVVVWTARGTEKIKQDADYSARHEDKVLSISAFRNEYESAQIVMTADGNIKEYEVETADLKNAAGDVLSKDSFTLYNQKYVEVSTLKDFNITTGTGYYPDALLPYETAVEAGENCITDGKNQGVWVTVKPSKTQAAGEYTGSFKVTADGKEHSVPVSVKIYDYTLSDEVHNKSSFAIGWTSMGVGEMDTTKAMQEKYYDFLLDYRISPQHFPMNDMSDSAMNEEQLEEWLAYADKYTRDPRCSSFNLPFSTSFVTTTLDDGTSKQVATPNFTNLENLLRKMVEYSFEHEVNLFKKAMTYFIIYDEYDQNGTVDGVNYTLSRTYKMYERLALEYEESIVCENAEFKAEVLHDLKYLKDKLVGNLTEKVDVLEEEEDGDGRVHATMVTEMMYLHQDTAREMYYKFAEECYGDEGELWLYTCCFPLNPYPTYHTEDALLSSRLINWMMYKYDYVGNLYWTTTLNYYRDKESPNTNQQIQDYYDTALRFPSANGDGLLMYPGRPYDIYGPVATIRLASIRDGVEDYDLMYALEEYYKERGVSEKDFDSVLNCLNESLISGTMVRHGETLEETFATSREALGSLLETAANTGALVEKTFIKEGVATAIISAPETTVLEQDGKTLTAEAVDGIKTYTLQIPMEKADNYIQLNATANGKTYEMKVRLGGRYATVSGSDFVNDVNFETGGSASTETIDGQSALVLDFSSTVGTNFEHLGVLSATIDATSLMVKATATGITFNVYSYSETPVKLRILGQSGKSVFEQGAEVDLQQGWNEIHVSTSSFSIEELLDKIRFYVVDTQAQKIAVGKIITAG